MSKDLRVCLDLTSLQSQRTGVDRYLLTLLSGLIKLGETDVALTVLVNRGDRDEIEDIACNAATVVTASPGGRLGRIFSLACAVPAFTIRNGFNVVHSPSFIMPPVRAGSKHVVTVLDMTTHTRPECHTRLRRSLAFRAAVSSSIRRADLVLVPTNHVRNDVLRLFPTMHEARVRTVPLGLDPSFHFTGNATADRSQELNGDPYILFVGTFEPRKNLRILLDAYRRAVTTRGLRHRLVIAGPSGWGTMSESSTINTPWFREHVDLVGYVPQRELVGLFRGASLFVYPSIEEGFGYPPLEAMACGTPVIAGSTSSLIENLEGAAVLIAPDDPDALAEAIFNLANNQEHQNALRTRGLEKARQFTEEATARRTLECYRELARYDG